MTVSECALFPSKLYFPFLKGLDGLEPTATHAEASAPEAFSLTSLFCVFGGGGGGNGTGMRFAS